MLLKNQNTVLQTLMWNNFRFLTMKRNRGNYILYHPTTKVGLWIKTEYCLKCSGGAVLPDICCRSQNFFPQNKERSQFERGLQAGSNNAWERQKCWIRACRWEQISTFSSISEMPCCTSPGGWETGSCAKTITRWWKCSWWQLLSQASAEISAELRNTKALWRVEGMGSRWCASGCREGGGNRIISKLMFCVTLTARSQDKKEKEWASGPWKQHWRSQVTLFFCCCFPCQIAMVANSAPGVDKAAFCWGWEGAHTWKSVMAALWMSLTPVILSLDAAVLAKPTPQREISYAGKSSILPAKPHLC